MNVRSTAFAAVYKIGPGWSADCTRPEEKEDADFKMSFLNELAGNSIFELTS